MTVIGNGVILGTDEFIVGVECYGLTLGFIRATYSASKYIYILSIAFFLFATTWWNVLHVSYIIILPTGCVKSSIYN